MRLIKFALEAGGNSIDGKANDKLKKEIISLDKSNIRQDAV
jgi:hypothetical protein